MSDEVETYCERCGRELVFRKRVINYYDCKTGEPNYHYIYVCPMRRYLLFWHAARRYYEDEGKLKQTFGGF